MPRRSRHRRTSTGPAAGLLSGFYVTVMSPSGWLWSPLLGPFDQEGQAVLMVGEVEEYAKVNAPHDAAFAVFGTAEIRAARLPTGRLNLRRDGRQWSLLPRTPN